MLDFILILILAVSSNVSAELMAHVVGVDPRVLKHITWQETRGVALGVHVGDAHLTHRVWRQANRVGWLEPWCQGDGLGWSSRGAWGLMAAYHVRFLGRCAPAWVFDVPLVSAYVAAKKIREHCAKPPARRHSRTARWMRFRPCWKHRRFRRREDFFRSG